MSAAPNAVVRAPQGHLVVPICNSVLGPDDKLFSPFGYVWLEVLILIGRWQPDGRIEWQVGPRLTLNTEQSTRGLFEPTIEAMPHGRLLMVMRASNANQSQRPGYKWYSVSSALTVERSPRACLPIPKAASTAPLTPGTRPLSSAFWGTARAFLTADFRSCLAFFPNHRTMSAGLALPG